ncbi:hypothetical protein HBI95_093330 [Parastagonospora nodorum]|nr:hypothetical protein HBI95_093330 [Parastagonospora nodorum]KAH4809306.1 hypothetical protein HBH61_114030 [Parastagonospora nodorum]KAH6133960.1 hypothetical protein HBI64_065500 [Parastagonospora nodorum]
MRLRLTVQRNSLPPANILWNVPDTNSTQAYTITRLLEDVNHVLPLESEHWGLEHYVVEVGGFECLHFSPVAQSLKDDDHVSIRPLMTAEERARTLTGRHQISDDGRRLVDGIPFGRPYLRNPSRPAVRIPPRKRRRIDNVDEENEVAGLFPDGGDISLPGGTALLTNGDTGAGFDRPAQPRRASKRVRFKGPQVEEDGDEDEDSDEDDEDFAPGGDEGDDTLMDKDTSGDEDDSDSGSDSDSDSSDASASSSSGSDSDDISSDSDSDSDASSPPEVRSSKGAMITRKGLPSSPNHVVPGEGRATTRSRNARRTRTNRLRYLKEAGILPADADLKALDAYETVRPSEIESKPEASKPFSTYSGKRKRVDHEDVIEHVPEDVTELEQRKKELMAKFGEDVDSIQVQPDPTPVEPTIPQEPASSPKAQKEQPAVEKETPKKRLRPDTSAISRILARQAMPARKKPSKAKPVPQETPEPEGASDPDFWKSKINVSAFECWEEDYELSAPPFPFKQHWDPASKAMREKVVQKQKKHGKKKRVSMPVEEQEEEEEEKIFLDYDDTGATEDPDTIMSTQAAIEDQLRQDVATAAQADLPQLPEDLTTLANLSAGDMKEGAIIVCKFFTVNPITITPEISGFKTAIVHQEGDSGPGAGTIRLKIAQRDLPKRDKKFDSKGNRIYDGADQFFVEDEEEEDEGLWEGQFGELLEAKLLQAA